MLPHIARVSSIKNSNMNTLAVLLSLLSLSDCGLIPGGIGPGIGPGPAGLTTIQKVGFGPSTFVRAPSHDSASIESHRLGGNFAYATAEAHAYAQVTPEISEATYPDAETTYVHQEAPVAVVQPADVVRTVHAARPVFGQQPVLAQEPVVGPVAVDTLVEQSLVNERTVDISQPPPVPVVANVAVPAVAPAAYAAAPLALAPGAPAYGNLAPGAPANPGYSYSRFASPNVNYGYGNLL